MAKKILNTILKIFVLCIVYILQIYILNNVSFFGAKADLLLMVLSIISMVSDNKKEIYTYAVLIGILNDILFGNVIGRYLLINILLVTLLSNLKNTYKQDNKFSVVIFCVAATVIFELFVLVFNIFLKHEIINIFFIIWTIIKKCIVNLLFAYIIYLIWTRCIKNR